MITSKQALQIILENSENFCTEEIPFLKTVGRILKEDVIADRDFPPFNRVSMDGIAVQYAVFERGVREFKIEDIQAAGAEQLTMNNTDSCFEVMTGAVLPKNTDSVIPYEQVTIENKIAKVITDQVRLRQNVHHKGKDRKCGEVLVKKNTRISPAEIGVFATVGKNTVKVAKLPKTIIISTGDELVEVSENPLSHQIRKSNVYTLVSLLKTLNIDAETAHIKDEKELLNKKISDYLTQFDVLIFSGAVSKGKFDYLPEELDELGVKKLFHKVKQRPGKPFWFGKKETKSVFAFPGNPVSTFVGCVKYFYPWYQKSVGINYNNNQKAILAEDFFFKPALTYFLQVSLENLDGKLMAIPKMGNGSGDLANLADADAFLELPDDRSEFKKGEFFSLLTYRN